MEGAWKAKPILDIRPVAISSNTLLTHESALVRGTAQSEVAYYC